MLAALFLVSVAVAVVGLILISGGTYETYPRADLLTVQGQRAAPAWTAPCVAHIKDDGGRNDLCARVSGRVVWVQKHDPDGDGDRHFVVAVHGRLRIVKIMRMRPLAKVPRIGSHIDATGYLMLGASGHHELNSLRFRPGGPSGTER